MLLEKAALRRLILPAVLRELFLTGCALTPVVLAHCEENAAVCGHTILLLSRLPVQKAISAYDLKPNVSVVSRARQ